jgi:exodeoxyribonuclease V beta subunit
MKSFDKENIKLEGCNLIEASAGTGKTYSIAILVLRLLLEKGVLIQEILLVTFTEAAASELKERTALFIRKALKEAAVSTQGLAEDKTIWRIIHRELGLKSVSEVKSILHKALLDIDLASIQTIHSFCQGTLTEFAFETNQIYGGELIKNTEEIIIRFLNEYWRTKIAVIPAELQNLFPDDFRGMLQKGAALVLSNHTFTGNCFETDNYEEIESEQAIIKKKEDQILIDYFDLRINNMKSEIVEYKKTKKGYRENSALEKLDDFLQLGQYLIGTPKFNFDELFEEEIKFCKDQNKSKRDLKQEYINRIISEASIEVAKQVKVYLNANNLLTFDALIADLHAAKDEEKLKKVLRAKYAAIFIDEFQDTDKLQYEIFETVFQENPESVLFYIGDPKQSIYAFRKADLNTYFRAKEKVGMSHTWTMNVNFRSTDSYVEAMNDFFKESDDFSTFHYKTKEIEYYEVEASPNNTGKIGICNAEKEVFTPLEIRTDYPNKDKIQTDLTNLVVKLLDRAHTIENRLIVPSDIGVLVRSNADGRTIKSLLEKKGVPAIVVDDSSVFKCNEANDINFVLNGILLPNKSNIDKALLTHLIGYKSDQLIAIDHDKILLLFRKYHQIWSKSGVYSMLHQFLIDFGIETKWTNDTEIGHRVLSNIFQLTELLQKISISRNFTPSKLKAYLQNAIQTSEKQDDAFTQRIERDEDAVKIATIHKSKGLQYNIVLLPNLDFTAKERGNFSNFKDENKEYLYAGNPIINQSHSDLFLKQEEQENRRLIYVAITRACFNCFVFTNIYHLYKSSSIKNFTKKLEAQNDVTNNLVSLNGSEDLISEETYAGVESSSQTVSLVLPNTKPNDHNWNKMSYSFLAAPHKIHPTKNNTNYEEGYDRFIFKELEKGIHVGNMLHNVFEYLDFTDRTDWDKVIEISLQQFTASKKELYAPWMKPMVQHVLNTNIQIGTDSIRLYTISNIQKVNELEFDFPIDATFDIKLLQGVFSPNDPRFIYTGFGEVKGMLTGFVDLFFEHQGKYYILDWKSNFLGDQLEHYHPDLLNDAMNDSNYHLQYCIYTIAMKRYLESKILSFDYETQFGGVIYLFLRGIRQGSNTGVFTAKLAIEEIQKIERIFNLEKITN